MRNLIERLNNYVKNNGYYLTSGDSVVTLSYEDDRIKITKVNTGVYLYADKIEVKNNTIYLSDKKYVGDAMATKVTIAKQIDIPEEF